MVKMIKLTEVNHNGGCVWINAAHIIKMYQNMSGGTTIFLVNKDSFVRVTEAPETVIGLINGNQDQDEVTV